MARTHVSLCLTFLKDLNRTSRLPLPRVSESRLRQATTRPRLQKANAGQDSSARIHDRRQGALVISKEPQDRVFSELLEGNETCFRSVHSMSYADR